MTLLEALPLDGTAVVLPPAAPDGDSAAGRGPEHVLSGHTPLWAYCNPDLARPWAEDGQPPLFEILSPDTSPEQAAKRTNLLVFAGAERTPALDGVLDRPEVCKLIFEPEPEPLERLAQDLGAQRLKHCNCFLIGGDPEQARPPLSVVLAGLMRRSGYPAFLVQQGLDRSHPGYLRRLITGLEINFYRLRIRKLEGQNLARSRPVRDITRGLFFDQQKHLYENLPDLAASPDLSAVNNAFPGATAIITAAGPDLHRRLDWIRDNGRRALIIAISRTAAELAGAGIRPHFTIINDASLESEALIADLPDMGRSVLVAHGLSGMNSPSFRRRIVFHPVLPQLLGDRPGLRLHGTVLTTAFSLARWLGCARAVLVGAQMSSDNPWRMAYSPGSSRGQTATAVPADHPLTHRHPQRVPVTAASGRTVYTSLDFLDTTHWLLDEIRESDMEVVNTSEDSIVHGRGVTVDPDYRVPDGLDAHKAFAALELPGRKTDPALIRRYLREEEKQWRDTARAADNVLANLDSPGGPAAAARLIQLFDANNTTYLVHRFRDFNNAVFHAKYILTQNDAQRRQGAVYLLRYIRLMAEEFLAIIAGSTARMEALSRQP